MPPLLCTTLRLGATNLGLGSSLLRGSHPVGLPLGGVSFILSWLACLQARWERTDRASAHDAHARRILQCQSDSRFLSWARSGLNFPAHPPWHKVKARAENAWEMENRQEYGHLGVWWLSVVPVPSASLLPNTSLWGPPCAGWSQPTTPTPRTAYRFFRCVQSRNNKQRSVRTGDVVRSWSLSQIANSYFFLSTFFFGKTIFTTIFTMFCGCQRKES